MYYHSHKEQVIIAGKETILNQFRYLELTHNTGELEENLTNTIKAGRLKWRSISGVSCDKLQEYYVINEYPPN